MSAPLASFGIVRAAAGEEDELGRRLEALLEPTRAEPGCLRYSLFRSKQDPAIWLFFEEWRSDADLQAHVETPHFQTFVNSSMSLVAKDGISSYPSLPVG